MGKLTEMVDNGQISVQELCSVNELVELANLAAEGVEACKKTIVFPLGTTEVQCYSYIDRAGEYESWGSCRNDGIFECASSWGGPHIIGYVDITSYEEVFKALRNEEFRFDLERFLRIQIEKATTM